MAGRKSIIIIVRDFIILIIMISRIIMIIMTRMTIIILMIRMILKIKIIFDIFSAVQEKPSSAGSKSIIIIVIGFMRAGWPKGPVGVLRRRLLH